MVLCQQTDINRTTEHRRLNEAATHLTTTDLAKAKLGDPIMPTTPYKVAAIIDCQIHTLVKGFTTHCPLALRLRNVSVALKETAGAYNNMPDYRYSFAAQILWQVTDCTTKFFSYTATPPQLAQLPPGTLIPFPTLHQLAHDIRHSMLALSVLRPACFHPPATSNQRLRQPTTTDTSAKRSRGDSGGRGQTQANGTTRQRTEHTERTEPHTRTLNHQF